MATSSEKGLRRLCVHMDICACVCACILLLCASVCVCEREREREKSEMCTRVKLIKNRPGSSGSIRLLSENDATSSNVYRYCREWRSEILKPRLDHSTLMICTCNSCVKVSSIFVKNVTYISQIIPF